MRACSSTACDPPPTVPKPSSVGVPSAAVKFPSEPPPTMMGLSSSCPSSWATLRARANRCADTLRSHGGRLIPPSRWSCAPGMTGRNLRSALSTRCCSRAEVARESIDKVAFAGTVLVVVPDCMKEGTTEVPASGLLSPAILTTCDAISVVALMPFSGSTPAWAARPVTLRW